MCGRVQRSGEGVLSFLSTAREVSSPEDLEALEKEVRDRLNRLGGLAVGLQIQQALDSQAAKEAEKALRDAWPYGLRDKGQETVRIATVPGFDVQSRVSYFARKSDRRGRKRHLGVYLGLLWLGIHERCTPGLASQVSLLAAMLGSLQEATEVLAERGIGLGVKVVRKIAYRFAQRAPVAQRLQGAGLEPEAAGRRVVVWSAWMGAGSGGGRKSQVRTRPRGAAATKGRGANRSCLSSTWSMPKARWSAVSCR
jgi:hypothetical protein